MKVPNTNWEEPVLVWLTVAMPTGSWIFDDASFEKMGALMHENGSRLLGFYDELSAFLTQINLYRGCGLSDSHEPALFLQLYNGHPWRRDTGT